MLITLQQLRESIHKITSTIMKEVTKLKVNMKSNNVKISTLEAEIATLKQQQAEMQAKLEQAVFLKQESSSEE